MPRTKLPQTRRSETLEFVYPPESPLTGLRFTATVSYYDDGRVGELFLSAGKSEQTMESIARDLAVVVSIALQYGAPLQVIEDALTQTSTGKPAGPLGVLFQELKKGTS